VIVVDSSVWIDFLNGRNVPHVRRLRAILGTDEITVGDLMMCEVLQGVHGEADARHVEALLRRFDIVPMAGELLPFAPRAIFVPCADAASPSARLSTSLSAPGASKTAGRFCTTTAISVR
jgi:predicted nucleic acid-binding protein